MVIRICSSYEKINQSQTCIQDFLFGGGGGMGIRKRGGCDEKEGSGRQIPMSINMPHTKGRECPTPPITNESSSSIWWEVLGRRGTSASFFFGGGGSQVSHPPV